MTIKIQEFSSSLHLFHVEYFDYMEVLKNTGGLNYSIQQALFLTKVEQIQG
jgi:hypothetical protein